MNFSNNLSENNKVDLNAASENENVKNSDTPIKAEIRKKEEKQRDNGQA